MKASEAACSVESSARDSIPVAPSSSASNSSARQKKFDKRENIKARVLPTHFLAVSVDQPDVLAEFRQLQDRLRRLDESLPQHFIDPQKLHITLGVLVLRGDDDVAASQQLLVESASLVRSSSYRVQFNGVNQFGRRILYLEPAQDEHCTQLCSYATALRQHFQRFLLPGELDRPFVPHATVLKPRRGRLSLRPYILETVKGTACGVAEFGSLKLLKMSGGKDGRYPMLAELHFASPTTPTVVPLQLLAKHGEEEENANDDDHDGSD